MKKLLFSLTVVSLCFISCEKKEKNTTTEKTTTTDTIVKTTEEAPEKPMDSIAQAQAWEAYSNPGEAHKMFAEEIGKWDCEMKFWMAPDAPFETAYTVADVKMILGGRYQEASFKGKMGGMDYEGKSTLAYNNANKEITSTYIDNWGTGMMVGIGKYDEATKSIKLNGEMVNPINGKKTAYRETYTIVDANTRKMEMFDTKDGKEYKSMEMVMTRK